MSGNLQDVLTAALALSAEERSQLAKQLLASLDHSEEGMTEEEVDAAWAREADRRLEAYKNGAMGSEPGEALIRRLWRKYAK